MNRRILKKKCKIAAAKLVRHSVVPARDIGPCDPSMPDSVTVPRQGWSRHQFKEQPWSQEGFVEVDLLKGTLLVYTKYVTLDGTEYDAEVASRVWDNFKFWNKGFGRDRERAARVGHSVYPAKRSAVDAL